MRLLSLGIAALAFAALAPAVIQFGEIAPQAGLDFVLENGATSDKYLIETMPGGIAVFDYDGDGRPDIFFTNGAAVPSLAKSSPKFRNRLFHNEGNNRFKDVTSAAGVAGEGYSMGAAAADFDNDGNPDLFVAGVNRNILYRNRGDGTFEDITAKSGMQSGTWAVAAGWFDYDGDGKLDLLIVRYASNPLSTRFCGDRDKGIRVYCNPKYFDPLPPILYRNRGNGLFEDVSDKTGISKFAGRGMSIAFGDYDNDGRPDVFITNDNMPNFLLHNLPGGRFEEVALSAGVALLDHGKPVSSMGADFRDYDNDGRPDIFVTALAGETFPLFRNLGKSSFLDATYASRLGPLTSGRSGWGVLLADFDNDGCKDLFTANSHVNDRVEQFESHRYKEPNSIFRNLGNGKFEDATPNAGAAFTAARKAHRGAALADFDGDGRLDVVVSALGEPAELWLNRTPASNNWIAFRLHGSRSNRDGIGARIHLGTQWNEMTSAVSYASSSLIPVHFGLGSGTAVPSVEILWPSGRRQQLHALFPNRVVDVTEPH